MKQEERGRPEAAEITRKLQENNIKRIKLGVTDIDGVLRGKYVSIDKFTAALSSNLSFCDVIFGWDIADVLYDNAKTTGWHTGYPDANAAIDVDSFRVIPWEPGTAFFFMDLFTKQGEPHVLSPRQVLRSVLAKASAAGYSARMAAEYEFWIFAEDARSLRRKSFQNLKPLSPGMFGYSVLRASQNAPLVLDLIDHLNAFDIPLEGFHTETGPGVYEAAIAVDDALAAADKAALFKTAVKEICAHHGVVPTFMAKWNADLPGSGGHIHQSIYRDGKNAFYDGGPSSTMASYIAGLVEYLPELMALICPTINSYKRTVPGTWAPINSTWGEDNRTAAIRSIPGSEKSSRIELRLCGADINPYIAMAASLAAGLQGVEDGRQPPPPVSNAYESGDARPLPRDLREANDRLRGSAIARKWLSDEFIDHYCGTRDWEVRQAQRAVTNWELHRYFESI